MKKGIVFILEDYPKLLDQIINTLERANDVVIQEIEVRGCTNISDANDLHNEIKNDIICMVCDSNMVSIGLPHQLKEQSSNGLYAGWLWLCNKIDNGDTSLLGKSIIYTAYYDELQQLIRNNEKYQKYSEGILIIRKKTVTVDDDELLESIISVVKRNQ